MSNGKEIIIYLVIFFGILSAVGLLISVIDMADIAIPDDPQNVTGLETGQNIEKILRIGVVLIFGTIISGVIIFLLTGKK